MESKTGVDIAAALAGRQVWTGTTCGPDQTRALAAFVARALDDGATLALCGPLGSGKTCFAQGLAAALGIRQPIVSPTYSLVREYREGPRSFVHVDLYRLTGRPDLQSLGLDEFLPPEEGLAVFEWADRFPEIFPVGTWWVRLATADHACDRREIHISPNPHLHP